MNVAIEVAMHLTQTITMESGRNESRQTTNAPPSACIRMSGESRVFLLSSANPQEATCR
jgi:hypothetical protein